MPCLVLPEHWAGQEYWVSQWWGEIINSQCCKPVSNCQYDDFCIYHELQCKDTTKCLFTHLCMGNRVTNGLKFNVEKESNWIKPWGPTSTKPCHPNGKHSALPHLPTAQGLDLLSFCSRITPPFSTILNLILLPWLFDICFNQCQLIH